MDPLLRIRNLRVGDAAQPRLDGFDLELKAGDRLGLLGINGAGKSTLLLVLAGVIRPSAGTVEWSGEEGGDAMRRHVGFLPQRVACYPELSVRENLDWCARLRGLRGRPARQAIDRALERVQLGSLSRRLAGQLSAGMLQRLGLAQALLHEPSLLLLDEPTASLDPVQTAQIRTLLNGLPETVGLLLATHLFDDILEVCQRVAFVADGRKITERPVEPGMDLMAHFEGTGADVA
jgi:ABC-2 type transport system ATP-binding protein